MKSCNICPYEPCCTIDRKSCNKEFVVFDIATLPEHDAKVRAETIDEFVEKLFDELIPMRDKKFDIAKGTAMPERYTHLKVMDTLDMVIEMVKIKAEQLKEQKNG